MSELTRFRDYARTMSGQTSNPPRERLLWAQLANEIDDYLAEPAESEDLFGEISREPEPDPEREHICEECGDWPTYPGEIYCTDCLERMSEDERAANDPDTR